MMVSHPDARGEICGASQVKEPSNLIPAEEARQGTRRRTPISLFGSALLSALLFAAAPSAAAGETVKGEGSSRPGAFGQPAHGGTVDPGQVPIPVVLQETPELHIRSLTAAPTRFAVPFLFAASDGVHGYELFAWDGISAPSMVADLRTVGDSGEGGSIPVGMTAVGGRVYFSADDGQRGRELFYYDLDTGGQGLAAEINWVDAEEPGPEDLFVYEGILYFSADDRVLGRELWTFDPVRKQTRLYDLVPGGASDPVDFVQCGRGLYFAANSPKDGHRRLWVQEGLNGVPSPVVPVAHLVVSEVSREAWGQRIFLAADDGGGAGSQPWYYDCVEGKAGILGRINRTGSSNPGGFTIAAGRICFAADDGVHGTEVWSWDPSDGSMTMAELNTGGDSYPGELTNIRGGLVFSAYDGNHRLLCSWNPRSAVPPSCFRTFFDPNRLRVHEEVLLFSAYEPCPGRCEESMGRELWLYDGIHPPVMVYDIWPGPGNGM